jgi:hypothetical protein
VNLTAWAQTHKPEIGLAGAGAALTAFLFYKNRSSASTSTTEDTSSPVPSGAFVGDYVLSGAPTATAATTMPVGLIQKGSGFVIPGSKGLVETSSGGTEYSEIRSQTDLKSLEKAGTPVYYQSSAGVFSSIKNKKLKGGTTLFSRV